MSRLVSGFKPVARFGTHLGRFSGQGGFFLRSEFAIRPGAAAAIEKAARIFRAALFWVRKEF